MDRCANAYQYHREGYNCAQSVVAAFLDKLDLTKEQAMAMAGGFGGGVGGTHCEMCGAVSGAAMVIGSLTAATEGHDAEGKQKNYELVQEFARRFIDENGSVICHELLGLDKESEKSPKPDSRTAEYYKKRPCVELVECAAAILEDMIKEYE